MAELDAFRNNTACRISIYATSMCSISNWTKANSQVFLGSVGGPEKTTGVNVFTIANIVAGVWLSAVIKASIAVGVSAIPAYSNE
jgi:hypothetical protein